MLAAASPVMSQTHQVAEDSPVITKLALFKNGNAFVTMSLQPVDNTHFVRLAKMPVPAHGTLWFDTDGSTSVASATGSRRMVEDISPNYSMAQLAMTNPGAIAHVGTVKGATFRGEVIVPGATKESIKAQAAASPYLYLRSETGVSAIPAGQIDLVEFPGATDIKFPTMEREEAGITLHLDKIDTKDPVRISCITQGITWAPSYRLELGPDGKGTLHAKAEIINELADINNAQLELITGYPAVPFAALPAPLSMRQSMAEFLRASGVGFQAMPEQRRGIITSNVMNADMEMAAPPMAKMAAEEAYAGGSALSMDAAVRAEDLFFYPVSGFTCSKGQTLSIPLFSGSLPYEHVLTWDVADYSARRPNPANPDVGNESQHQIWHCVRITNSLSVPLTTAPVEFTSGGRFIGQSTMGLTPPGLKKTVRVNLSMDVTARDKEAIVSQTPVEDKNYRRTKTATTGELKATNHSGKPVTMEIRKTLIGLADSCSDKGDISKSDLLYDSLNPVSVIKWDITIEPGESKTVTYSYTRLN